MMSMYSPRSVEYILPVTLSTSVTLVSPFTRHHSLKMYLEAVIERVWRYTCRLRSSELRDALGERDRANLEMHLKTERSSEFRDSLGGCDRVNSEMHLEAEIK